MSFISQKSSETVKRIFEKYYQENLNVIHIPKNMERREYGYFIFNQRVMVRHLAFQRAEELRAEIAKVAPLHVYRSAAYYRYPKAPMEEKEWLGADLTFDIDADHMGLECVNEHTYEVCQRCGILERGSERCPDCGLKPKTIEWVCEECLNAAKAELIKLLDILLDDFGVSEGDIEAGFSGNRGYHVSVNSSDLIQLDQLARREVVNYLSAAAFEPRLHGIPSPIKSRRGRSRSLDYPEPRLDSWGWRGRIIKRIYTELTKRRDELASKLGMSGEELKTSAELWLEEPTWRAASPRIWDALAREAAAIESVKIDPVVTTDLHRLIRLSGTLNGKTGLLACKVGLDDVESFDPLRDAVVLKNRAPIRVKVIYAPPFTLGEEQFDEVVEPRELELPTHVAVYLICRGLAEVV